jgi:hypothetical protein
LRPERGGTGVGAVAATDAGHLHPRRPSAVSGR